APRQVGGGEADGARAGGGGRDDAVPAGQVQGGDGLGGGGAAVAQQGEGAPLEVEGDIAAEPARDVGRGVVQRQGAARVDGYRGGRGGRDRAGAAQGQVAADDDGVAGVSVGRSEDQLARPALGQRPGAADHA